MSIFAKFKVVLSALVLGFSLSTNAAATLTFAVVPQARPAQISNDWQPMFNALTQLTGVQFDLLSFRTIPDFEESFLKGQPDFVYLNPYHAVMAKKAAGYVPIIRDGASSLTGILVVRKDSAIKNLQQLDGATLAFPAPNAFGASLYMRALLSKTFKININPLYVTTHSNVYRNVILKRALAGGGVRRTLERQSPEAQAQLRVLYETPSAASHPIVVHPRVPVAVRDKVQQAFLKMGVDPAFVKTLRAILMPVPVKADFSKDYAPLQALNLGRLVELKAP
jgi:phosphonate transport system substrate-binding protein